MNTDSHRFYQSASVFIFISLFLLASCAPTSTSTPFRPPTKSPPTEILPTTTSIPQVVTAVQASATSDIPTAPTIPLPCTNNLTFVSDTTVPDGTVVLPGTSVDKQWLVDNSGTCNWDSNYRLKWIGGDPLTAVTEQALYPARAGTQATLRIIFTAPNEVGTYGSMWQAFGPDGVAFGDPVYMEIVVE